MPIVLMCSLLAGALSLLCSTKVAPSPKPSTQTQGDAHQRARQLLQRARSLRCSFDTGATTFLDSLPPSSQSDRLPGSFVFDSIDRSTNRARLTIIGGIAAHATASDVTVIQTRTSETLSFLERAPLGGGLYTVFAAFTPVIDGARTQLVAVSYGYTTLPRPNVGTFYGSCRVLN